MMNRSEKIFSRIRNKLKSAKITGEDEILNKEIYDAMQMAQDAIFARVQPEKTITVITKQNYSAYPLQSGWNLGGNLHTKSNAASIENESDNITGWEYTGTLESVEDPRPDSGGIYSLKHIVSESDYLRYELTPEEDNYIEIDMYLKATSDCTVTAGIYYGDSLKAKIDFDVKTTWQNFTGSIGIPGTADNIRLLSSLYGQPVIKYDDTKIIRLDSDLIKGETLYIDDISFKSRATENRAIISKIKEIIPPTGWSYSFENVSSQEEWERISLSEMSSSQPLYWTIYGNNLLVYPAPSIGGDIIQLYVTLDGSETEITSTQEPSLRPIWDNAIQFYALSTILGSADYLSLYEREIANLSYTEHVHHTKVKRTSAQLKDKW